MRGARAFTADSHQCVPCLVSSTRCVAVRVAPRSFLALDATLHQGGAVAVYFFAMCTIVQTKFLDNECYVSGPPSLSPFQHANLAAQKPSRALLLLPEAVHMRSAF